MGAFSPDDPVLALHGFDLVWPLALDGNNDLATVSGEDNTLSALPIRAATTRGEIPFFPLDGIDLEDLQGGLNSDGERAALRGRLVEQYRSREDRLESVNVAVGDGTDSGDTVALVTAKFRGGAVETIEVPFGSG